MQGRDAVSEHLAQRPPLDELHHDEGLRRVTAVRAIDLEGLADAGAHVAALKEVPAGDATILQLWNDGQIALSGVFGVCSLMGAVHPQAEVRDAAEALN